MKVSIKGYPTQFTLVSIVTEEVEIPDKDKKMLSTKSTQLKGIAYVFDKDRKAHKFLAEDIERYD